MPYTIMPSMDSRLAGLQEIARRHAKQRTEELKPRPVITISREFGCEAFPMAVRLKELLEKKTGDTWTLMDKALFEKIASNLNLVKDIFERLDEEHHLLDEMISTFAPSWKNQKDYYRDLCRQMVTLAEAGNVIMIGRGSSVITQRFEHSYHFRMVAPLPFRINSIRHRAQVSKEEALDMVEKMQKAREKFIKDFLNQEIDDPYLYHMVFNNHRCPTERIADIICEYVTR